ncbi:sigma-70 family RNA polymerase sigma factor [Bradyrhizobium brasilense]|uniref:sigma-70 family RNA polymerase sigma factor n=1 Tax=Bradyrhizobium brasilense TaxID=1419277 RepID=UPI002877DBCC|nr:sigma-70 family RNA polymerase sigma factor [Bradyrhizobium brasilense]MCP3418773.1 sigma-70 family RNA polymerase sigma factor [Bradyrhizobium brasilense]
MTDAAEPSAAEIFAELRPRLIRLAYRMLGSVADAEDVVHSAWVRWLAADRDQMRDPKAVLHTIVTRLSLNELKSARRRRAAYVGPWLPEPFFDPEAEEAADDLILPLMIALERLSPLERAAFLLHDVFGLGFDAVSETIGREAATCRKLASRARAHIHDARPRFVVGNEEGLRLANAFFTATRTGNLAALRAMLAEDVVVYADGGGQVPAPTRPLVGLEAAMERFAGLARLFATHPSRLIRYAIINGLPGFITIEDDLVQTTALHVENKRVVAVYVTRNPDKLHNVPDVTGWRN